MKLAFAISGVPARRSAVARLMRKLQQHTVRVRVDDPPSGSSWPNYRTALEDAGADKEDWLVSLDDDALLCHDFVAHLRAALFACPGGFATFYLANTTLTSQARACGASWISTLRVVHGICWAIRPALAREAIETAERLVHRAYRSGDQRLQAWLAATGRWNFVATPNLVDHRSDMRSEMTPGAENGRRTSAWFGTRNGWTRSTYFDKSFTRVDALRRLAVRGALTVPYDTVLR